MIKIVITAIIGLGFAGFAGTADAQSRRDRDRASDSSLVTPMQMRRTSPRDAARDAARAAEREEREAAENAMSQSQRTGGDGPQNDMDEEEPMEMIGNARTGSTMRATTINPRPGPVQTPAPGGGTVGPQAPTEPGPSPEPSPGGDSGGGTGHPEAPFDPVETPFSGADDDKDRADAARARQRNFDETREGQPRVRDNRNSPDSE